ncbi:acetylglutamate kinase [Elstera litoralis]|uniref:Acetylglutamate kinase n=1 Tax=Elstera litoralis TaxID=552518 RepID=A0A0F3IRZ9_9PROT|nr:metallopeptidase family protein [Elstera litoralis]KJV09323.1 acetylglutamate kinase [Elstera litoralis]
MTQYAPNLDAIARLAETALADIPPELRQYTRDLVLKVEDFPDDGVVEEMGLESPFDLLGLYQGVAMPLQSVSYAHPEPHRVFLYRRPILDYWCETGEALDDIVRHVLIHEIGHHFGFSDEDMERIEGE